MATLDRRFSFGSADGNGSGDRKPRIVCVDDEPAILELLRRLLQLRETKWDLRTFCDSKLAWSYLQNGEADLVITDVSMPGMSGPDLIRALRDNERTRDIPVVALTAQSEASLKRELLELGATDLLAKPIQADDLVARIRNGLRLKQCQDALKQQNRQLEQLVAERTRQLQASRVEIIWRLATAAEFRDEQTGNHVLRVAHSSRLIADALGQPRQFVENLFLAAPLHDLGKIGIPDSILHKPSRLTDAERKIVQTHCEIGERILGNPGHLQRLFLFHGRSPAEGLEFGDQDPVLQMAKEIAGAHHERWDGRGYPRSLAGEQIPLAARIVAIADVYDALTSARPYKPAYSAEESRHALRLESGRHFDPAVHAAFEKCWLQIEEIRSHLPEAVPAANGPDAFGEYPGVATSMENSLVASASAEWEAAGGSLWPAADSRDQKSNKVQIS